MDMIEIDLQHCETYEAGATLVALLALPNGSDKDRRALQASYCHLVLRGEFHNSSDEAKAAPRIMKPIVLGSRLKGLRDQGFRGGLGE
jgi:hypothetical protein